MMHLGLVKWFDNDKGFGRIGTVSGDDVFLHIDQFIVKPEKVLKLKALFFDIETNNKGNKATNVSNPDTYEHFLYIMSLLESNPKVNIEFTIKGKSRWGNEYIRKEYRDCSIFDSALYQLLRHKDAQTIYTFFINYFDENQWNSIEKIQKLFNVTRDAIKDLKVTNTFVDAADDNLPPIISNSELLRKTFKHFLSKINEEFLFELWSNEDYYLVKSRSFIDFNMNNNYFEFPDVIFLDNYKAIDSHSLKKIIALENKENICYKIISNQINDYSTFNNTETLKIAESINCLIESEIFSELYENLISKNIELISTNNSENKDELSRFKEFLTVIGNYQWKYSKLKVIDIVNSKLPNDTIFNFWKETRYFVPGNEFILENINKLTRNDFLNTSLEFRNEFLLSEFQKIKYDNSLSSFCNVIFLVFEISKCQIQIIENEFLESYKVAIWLYNSYFNKNKSNYYQIENNPFEISFTNEHFIQYLVKVENLSEIITLVKIICEIDKIYKSRTTPENTTGLFKFTSIDRTKIIDEVCSKQEFSFEITELIILKKFLAENAISENIDIAKCFFPKFINPEEDLVFNELLKFSDFFENNIENKNNFYTYISELVSFPKLVTLWYYDYINTIDLYQALEFLQTFDDKNQFIFLQKIFSLIHLKKSLISAELFNKFENLASNPSINLNVRIALYVLNSLKLNNQFIQDKTIFELVSQRLNENLNELIEIDELLDKCGGRTWKAFSYDSDNREEWYVNIGGHEFPVDDNVISINNKSYSLIKENKSVCINGIYYNFKWVKKRNVFHTENYGIPDGLTFCDAVKSQFDENLKSNFYWCCNSKCYSPCQKNYNPFQWEKYTLRDFIIILGIPFDNDLYYRFVSVVNRVNRLLEKLKCNSCNKLMRDAATSEFAFYRVNTFHCTDSNCSEFHKTVYLTHCLNWRCLNIIDTRVSKACSNGWYICDKCNNCCSQEKIDMRYQNLLTNAAFNPNNPRHQKLKFQVDNKLGHLERNEVYNYKTGEKK